MVRGNPLKRRTRRRSVSDNDRIVSLDEHRRLTLQFVLREWAGIVREPDWSPADEDDAAKLGDVLEAAADTLDGILNVCGTKWVQRRVPPGKGA